MLSASLDLYFFIWGYWWPLCFFNIIAVFKSYQIIYFSYVLMELGGDVVLWSDIFNWHYQVVAFLLLGYVTWLPQVLPLVTYLLNKSDILVQAMNELHEMDNYWKEVVGEYM